MKLPLILASFTALLMSLAVEPAQALELAGKYGYIGEWEITATLAQSSSGLWSKEFTGPMRMRHTAMCMPGEVEEKSGSIRVSTSTMGAKVSAVLSYDGIECTYSGTLSEDRYAFVSCPGQPRLPLWLWVK